MGTHPIFESDFDCLTDGAGCCVSGQMTSAFDLFGVFAEKLFKYSTPISHGWWLVNFVFRMFVVGSVGSAIYDDEQGNFHCDTIQPGCKQLCFNRFSPMQHPRFWGFQMLFCTLPSVIFILITSNEEAQISKIDSLQDQFAADNMEDTEKCYENSKQYQKLEKKKKQIGTIKRKQVNLKPVNGAYQST